MFHLRQSLAVLVVTGLLTACSGQQGTGQTATAKSSSSTNEAAAADKLHSFHQMVDMDHLELAAQLGDEIVAEYPESDAAAEVKDKLPDLKKKAHAKSESRRLANLWRYQVSPMAGGTQSTATLGNSKPDDLDIRLVLRRQTDWGTSAFLYAYNDDDFVCQDTCTLQMSFDGDSRSYKVISPDSGEPSVMIQKHDDFIQRLKDSDEVDITANIQAKHEQKLVYETGGFDPDEWQKLDGQ